ETVITRVNSTVTAMTTASMPMTTDGSNEHFLPFDITRFQIADCGFRIAGGSRIEDRRSNIEDGESGFIRFTVPNKIHPLSSGNPRSPISNPQTTDGLRLGSDAIQSHAESF